MERVESAGDMSKVLTLAAIGEAATGVALFAVPSLVGRLLLGVEFAGTTLPVARVAGIALFSLAIACWPGPPLVGMFVYSIAITLYLSSVGLADGMAGILLWPAVGLHVVLTVLLGRVWLDGGKR